MSALNLLLYFIEMMVNCDVIAPRAIKITEGNIIPYIPSPMCITNKTITLMLKK